MESKPLNLETTAAGYVRGDQSRSKNQPEVAARDLCDMSLRRDRPPVEAGLGLPMPHVDASAAPVSRAPDDVPLALLVDNFLDIHHLELALTPVMWRQLAWQQDNHIGTCESSAQLRIKEPSEALHVEVRRSLGRLNCYNLLMRGDDAAYREFVAAQATADALDQEVFAQLSGFLRFQSPAAQEALKASCFAAMSPAAAQAAAEISTPDSEEFLSRVAANCPEAMPIWAALSPAARALLPKVYPPQTHLRHMLYTEGGNNMFQQLRGRIRGGSLSGQDLALWLGRWVINLAAFRAHESPRGAAYLNAPTAEALFLLVQELQHLQRDPTHDVLRAYLAGRARLLGMEDEPYLAHLAAMMRIYRSSEANELKAWFAGLSLAERWQREQAYAHYRSKLHVTPTYEPAVLANLRGLGCDITTAVELHDALTTLAQNKYFEKMRTRPSSEAPPLSYRKLGFVNVLGPLLQGWKENRSLPDLTVDDDGNCTDNAQSTK